MTKKDYEMIASVIRGLSNQTTKGQVAKDFATHLGYDNPRFQDDKFLKACGIEAETAR